MKEKWVTVRVERVLYINRGRDVILCDDNFPNGAELVLRLSPEAVQKLRDDL